MSENENQSQPEQTGTPSRYSGPIENSSPSTRQNQTFNQYLGDGCYVDFDGYQVRLYTSDGVCNTNEIFLDMSVLTSFIDYVENKLGFRHERDTESA
jgi:hypothetical protein